MYSLSLWLLTPCHDDPDTLFPVGLLTETGSMFESDARTAFANATYASVMADIEHGNEPVMLSLDGLDGADQSICLDARTLFANA